MLHAAYEDERALAHTVQAYGQIQFDVAQGWSRLSAQLNEASVKAAPTEQTERAGEGSAHRAVLQFAENMVREICELFLRPAPAFALGAAAALIVGIGASGVFRDARDGEYLTLSAPAAAPAAGPSFLVIFSPEATSKDILDFTDAHALALTGAEPSAGAFIFSAPTSIDPEEIFANREDLIEFYAEIR